MAMIIKANGGMEMFVVAKGEYAMDVLEDTVGGDSLPFELPDGSIIAFNRDGEEDGLPPNRTATMIATTCMAKGGIDPEFFGDCILFRPGEYDPIESEDRGE